MTLIAALVIWSAMCLAGPWMLYAWMLRSFPTFGRTRRLTMQVVVGLAVLEWPLAAFGIWSRSGSVATTAAAMTGTLIAITMALAPVTFARTLFDIIGARPADVRPGPLTSKPPADGAPLKRRQVVEAGAGLALLGATGTAIGWGFVRGRHEFSLSDVVVRIPGLARSLDGYTIVQISDIHAGVFVGEKLIEEGLSIVRRARPDLIVVTGDLVDSDPTYAPFIARKLIDLPTRDGLAVILGNHDYYAGAGEVAAVFRRAGIAPLINSGRVIRSGDGGGFALLGVDDATGVHGEFGGPRLDLALSAVPSDIPRILLSHQPQTVKRWAGQVALQLSGHTHGGQINPGLGVPSLLFPYVAGRYEVSNTTLYVNRGFGTSGPPVRIGAPPEITRISLVAA